MIHTITMDPEYCCQCGNTTGRAGIHDDSLYTDDGDGPFCEDCFEEVK